MEELVDDWNFGHDSVPRWKMAVIITRISAETGNNPRQTKKIHRFGLGWNIFGIDYSK